MNALSALPSDEQFRRQFSLAEEDRRGSANPPMWNGSALPQLGGKETNCRFRLELLASSKWRCAGLAAANRIGVGSNVSAKEALRLHSG